MTKTSRSTHLADEALSQHARAHFDITGWDEAPYDEPSDGPRLSRATVTKSFRGDLEGTSTAELLMCMADADDYTAGAGYVASERFTGKIGERNGGFVIQHGGVSGGGDERTFGHVVPGSGTGDFAGLSGTAEIGRDEDGKHVLTLSYSIG